MRRMVLTVLISAFAVLIYGQRNSLDDFFDSYSDRDGYTAVTSQMATCRTARELWDDNFKMDGSGNKITSVRMVHRRKEPVSQEQASSRRSGE
ncbi:MAG: hypothetical protein U5L72_18035 [Bacteroidales bacterium]|nr:hypothetical protein [Bacteroidales bacterium]